MPRWPKLLKERVCNTNAVSQYNQGRYAQRRWPGGDPLFPGNREEISELCREIRQKFPDKTIWLYTGYRWEEIKWLPFLDQIDVLIDGRFVQAQADPQLHWRGSANQRVIDVPRTLAANSIVLHDDK